MTVNKRVAIIGTGPAGAIALDALLDHGFTNIRVFERRSLPGGTWVGDDDLGFSTNNDNTLPLIDNEVGDIPIPIPQEASSLQVTSENPFVVADSSRRRRFDESSLYPELETNILPSLMSFQKKPVPKTFTSTSIGKYGVKDSFRPHQTIRDYVGDYFKGDNAKYVSYNTTVEKAEQPLGPGNGNQWVLTLCRRNNKREEWWTETFDFIYVASGRYNVPRVSHIDGLEESSKTVPQGVIEHTKYYRGTKGFENKKVLIVGASISSCDLVHLIKDVIQVPLYASIRHVLPILKGAFQQPFVDARGSISKIQVNKDGKTLDATFEDGSTVTEIEKLILATGYNISYPFLEEYTSKYGGGIVRDNALHNVFLTTWWTEDPSLVIAGIYTEGVAFRSMETQAMATAALWAGFPGSRIPPKEIRIKWEEERRKIKSPVEWQSWYPDFTSILNTIAEVGGGYRALCKASGIVDYDDFSILPTLYIQGFDLKKKFWANSSQEWIKKHPESIEIYEKTKALLDAKTLPSTVDINILDGKNLVKLIREWKEKGSELSDPDSRKFGENDVNRLESVVV